MHSNFGTLPSGETATLYTISGGHLRAQVTDYGATLVRLYIDDVDVVLGYDDVNGYASNRGSLGATIGRNANRIKNACFSLNGVNIHLTPNEGKNSLHSGPDSYAHRFWELDMECESSVRFLLRTPSDDQGFPGRATIFVTYALDAADHLSITYDAVSTRDTVFNLTNHTYFNLAGQDHPEKAMDQVLSMPSRFFTPVDDESIPTGELRSVEDTPFDFRLSKTLGRDIDFPCDDLSHAGGYDHNFEVFSVPCAILSDPESGRTMAVCTDRPGVQLYTANNLNVIGKNGVVYGRHSGVCLEVQHFPDSVNHPEWAQPFTPANQQFHSVTTYKF